MKLKFEPDLDYQHAAIEAVCDLFSGQEINRGTFTVSAPTADLLTDLDDGLGYGNRVTLLDDEVQANLHAVQMRNALPVSETLTSYDFTVEMETGTGKTYVYLRTVFELNKRFGFTKFVIVVPSVAIREGVAQTLRDTADHFRSLYDGVTMDSFVYDSAKLGQVRDFATASTIKVMVATIGAFNKLDTNTFYTPHEKTGGDKPVDLVRATRPILIVDEPQSVDGGENGKGRAALAEMRPLATLRYSATHANKHHMVYRLDAIDAYERKLVKRIDVAGLEVEGADNVPYVRIVSIKKSKSAAPSALIEIAEQQLGAVRRVERRVYGGEDLQNITNRALYAGLSIAEIEGDHVRLDIPGDTKWMAAGEVHGDIDQDGIRRLMIRRTIREHFEREKILTPMGIKVLSLFFIDSVEAYRSYSEDGARVPGRYATMFEEEYAALAKNPNFATLFTGVTPDASAAHDGYFSIDRKIVSPFDEHELKKGATKEAVAADSYNLIMKEKGRLLELATPLRFIFSHSALREGWDNPNVFQICSFREMKGDRERRQSIGRGLRLCVDSQGDRRRDEGLNVLTVIADESFSEFAEGLQSEIEKDLGIRFGVVDCNSFADLVYSLPDGSLAAMGARESVSLFVHLSDAGLVDAKGRITDEMRNQLKAGTLQLPEKFEPWASAIRATLTKLAGKLDIRNKDEERTIKVNKQVLLGADFKELWDRIKHKTVYRLAFKDTELIPAATAKVTAMEAITQAKARFRKQAVKIDRGGISGVGESVSAFAGIQSEYVVIPDVLTELQDRTQLTRRSLAAILKSSGRLDDLKLDPATFIDRAADAIKRAKRSVLIEGVTYQRIGDEQYYAQELFKDDELKGYLNKMVAVTKSPFEHVPWDSETIEKPFAQQLDANESVKVFAKLPRDFKVPTPLGSYNPDWAVLVDSDEGERLYFIVETKGSIWEEDLRSAEADKIACGRKHFAAIGSAEGAVRFEQQATVDGFLAAV
jgi:type III restriction enzyme